MKSCPTLGSVASFLRLQEYHQQGLLHVRYLGVARVGDSLCTSAPAASGTVRSATCATAPITSLIVAHDEQHKHLYNVVYLVLAAYGGLTTRTFL